MGLNTRDAGSIEFWLWPNVLSLDAPAIAILWQVALARCLRVRVASAATVALGLSVWVLYVADRILDGMTASAAAGETPRHRFYRRNRERAAPWAAALAVLTLLLALTRFPAPLLRDYLALAFGVSVYFGFVHAASPKLRARWPKELAVAIFFCIGVSLPVWTRLPQLAPELPLFIAFAALLWMNTLGIEVWESHPRPGRNSHLLMPACAALALICAIAALSACIPLPQRPLWAAIALSSTLLAALGKFRSRFSKDAIRVLADAALLTPLLLLPFIRR